MKLEPKRYYQALHGPEIHSASKKSQVRLLCRIEKVNISLTRENTSTISLCKSTINALNYYIR